MRILLVDDDAHTRRAVSGLLGRLGYNDISEAIDGQNALDELPKVKPDLIVTDCQMPIMDGIRLTRALRGSGVATPIIMITSAHDPAIAMAAKRAGVTHFLAKPLDLTDFCDALRHTLGSLPQAA